MLLGLDAWLSFLQPCMLWGCQGKEIPGIWPEAELILKRYHAAQAGKLVIQVITFSFTCHCGFQEKALAPDRTASVIGTWLLQQASCVHAVLATACFTSRRALSASLRGRRAGLLGASGFLSRCDCTQQAGLCPSAFIHGYFLEWGWITEGFEIAGAECGRNEHVRVA